MTSQAKDQIRLEREIKFDPSPEFDIANLSQGGPDDYLVSRPTLARLHTIYYDTADLRLARTGFNLRYRWDEGWTLKVPFERNESGMERGELPFEGDAATLPQAALTLLRGIVRELPVVAIAEFRTLRRQARVATIADVTDDDVSVVRDGRVVERFRQAEVEALEGTNESAIETLVERLQAIGAGEIAWEPKLERALGIPPAGASRRIQADAPAQALVRLALDQRLLDLLHNDFLVRLRTEPEDVHRARSAVRKLRAVLRGFRRSLDPMWADTLREELRWVAGELGAVRDIDVALASLRSHASEVASPDAPYVGQALGPLTKAREEGRRRLLATLGSRRYFKLIDRIEAASAKPRLVAESPATAGEIAKKTLRKISKQVRKAVRLAHSSVASNELHHARIQVRNGRYTAEACAAVMGKAAKRLARRLSRLQDVLGAINDANFVQDRLRATVGDARVPLVAGQLIAFEAVEGEKARRSWKTLRKHALRDDWANIEK